MANFTKILLRYCVPAVITVGLCYLLVRGMDLRQMWETICTQCDFRWIAVNILLLIGAMWARAARWQLQLRALGIKASVWVLTLSVFGTYAVNLVFPRLGEVWRTGFVAERQKAPFTTVFGSMVADRLSDTVMVGLISLSAFVLAGPQLMSYLGQNPGLMARVIALLCSPVLWGCMTAVLAVTVWIFVRYPENKVVAICRRLWQGLWEGFAVIGRMRGKGLWLFYTLILWACYFVGLVCAFMSFPLVAEVMVRHGLTAVLLCFVLTSLSMLVPSNGGIGPWQWAMIFGLSLYCDGIPGLTKDYMASFANLALGVQAVTSIILGLFTFAWIALTKNPKK
ncbi:lysylphosphatidylglycerol synthase transmembrane domain-containing protein [Duncaniella muricolitica]|uniref:lysylphosphatidylglycerol synthase transmembrane domain-containing protein n=1 Tax=Duncaniella muricolitica TaxID=2880704 RepID=UPI00244DDE24|nr:lysylphosphatidylglycerol synthase transmembrane domain-containing protein [Duncaniella muricolitica]